MNSPKAQQALKVEVGACIPAMCHDPKKEEVHDNNDDDDNGSNEIAWLHRR
jgi:hypothetical protein